MPSMAELLKFNAEPRPRTRTFVTNMDSGNNDRFQLVKSDFVTENMQK